MIAHKPTEESRNKVAELTSFGISQPMISKIMGISEDTLQKHYRHEIDTATSIMVSRVAKSLFEKAVIDKDVTSMIFILKTRGRWKTADNESLLESNDAVKEEIKKLREKLAKQNAKDY